MQFFVTMGAYQYRYEGEGKDTGKSQEGDSRLRYRRLLRESHVVMSLSTYFQVTIS